jgi:hypothetical protein
MASPDPVLFPPQVRDLFFKVKGTFLEEIRLAQEQELQKARELAAEKERQAELERARIARIEEMAKQETLIYRNRRWVAAVPFGVGQFQNGDTGLGALFLGTEALLLGTTLIAISSELSLHSQADGGRGVAGAAEVFTSQIGTARRVGLWAGASFLLVAAVGIAEAQINFVEEERLGVRRRSVPAAVPQRRPARDGNRPPRTRAPSLEPFTTGDEHSAVLGVTGRFYSF